MLHKKKRGKGKSVFRECQFWRLFCHLCLIPQHYFHNLKKKFFLRVGFELLLDSGVSNIMKKHKITNQVIKTTALGDEKKLLFSKVRLLAEALKTTFLNIQTYCRDRLLATSLMSMTRNVIASHP